VYLSLLRNILLSLIPLFVAVDAIGTLPIFISFTHDFSRKDRRKVIVQSMITAGFLSIVFIFVGKWIFNALGIEMGDFMVAGGAVLFSIAILDIIIQEKKRRTPIEDIGVVPLGTPLIAGPAVLTTSLILSSEYGLIATFISVIVNIGIAGLFFSLSHVVIKFLGISGSKALSKVTSLFLAAIAVMMIRKGITELIH
jgi:multiple antibiotic resistance protein